MRWMLPRMYPEKHRRNSLTKAHQFVPKGESEWEVMNGFTFNGDYIGYSTLSKPTTGVGVLQQPIKEQYLRVRKQGTSKKVLLRLVQSGLAISLVEPMSGGQRGEMFYDVNSISYIEGLRFAVLSGNDKKVRAMFVPLTEKTLPSVKDKNAFTVDKSYHFLTQINHPPMLACVLRRPKGIKALDCHVFMLENVDDAFKIVTLVRQMQSRGSDSDLMTEVRQNDNSFKRGQNSDVIRTEYGEYSVYRGQKQLELKDDFFRGPGQEMGRDGEMRSPEGSDHYGWSYERPRDAANEGWRSYDNGHPEDRFQGRLGSQNRGDYPYDYDGHNRQNPSDSVDGRMNMSFSDSSDRGGRYDDHSDRWSYNERERGNSPRASHIPPPVAEKPKPEALLRSVGPPSPGQHSPTRPLSPRGMDAQRSPNYQQVPGYQQPSPGGRNYPPPSPTGPVYSMSNLESRQTEPRSDEESQPKPVAKVPPHMVAGVKVLPTGFSPSALKLKPKTAKHDKSYGSEDSDPDYDNNFGKYKKPQTEYVYHSEKYTDERNAYNQRNGSSEVYQRQGDNYGRGEEHFDSRGDYRRGSDNDGFRDNYGRGGDYRGGNPDSGYRDNAQPRGFSYAPDYGRPQADEGRRYIENYDDQYAQQRGSDQRQGPNRHSAPSYEDGHDNRWSGSSGGNQSRSQSNYDVRAGEGQVPKGKEAEIASMFTNFHIQKGDHSQYTTSGTDFEQSLGYFP